MKFKEGQTVECLLNGKGTILKTHKKNDGLDYPIFVIFNSNKTFTYTIDGRLSEWSNITLTPGTWKVEEILPEPEFEKGQPVWVRDEDDQEWRLRYYSHKEGEKHFVYCEQKKSGITLNYKIIKPLKGIDPNN